MTTQEANKLIAGYRAMCHRLRMAAQRHGLAVEDDQPDIAVIQALDRADDMKKTINNSSPVE